MKKTVTEFWKLFPCLFFLFFVYTGLYAQTELILKYSDDTASKYSVTEAGKIYFSDTELVVEESPDITTAVSLSAIKKILFNTQQAAGAESVLQQEQMFVYPNPARDYLYVGNLGPGNMQVMIFALDGSLVLKQVLDTYDGINIGSLSSGLYVIRVNDTTSKFTKL